MSVLIRGMEMPKDGYIVIEDDAPVSPTKPAKHGKWVRLYNTDDSDCACSVCYRVQARPVGRYCKWCGARMDGE